MNPDEIDWGNAQVDQCEAWLDDLVILRQRKLTIPQIVKSLGQPATQVDRWVAMLKEQGRWPSILREPSGAAAASQGGKRLR